MQAIHVTLLALLACLYAGASAAGQTDAGKILTVCGPIEPSDLGPALTHEHVLVDFIGADKVSPDRYDPDEVFEVMLPYLRDLKAAGIRALFDCTPNYLGRDPALLRKLSLASGVHLITNTGLYKDPFLPASAHDTSAEEIAREWIREAVEGIGPEGIGPEGQAAQYRFPGTSRAASGIRPGFIKIAVNEGDLSEIQRKIVRAAALTSAATGLVIASHTTTGRAALQELEILAEVGVPPSHLIVVHSDAEPDQALHFQVAERGAWLSYDGIRAGNAAQKLPLVLEAFRRYPDRLLISQDAGWYHVGEPGGGTVAPLDWLPRHFLPMLRDAGLTDAQLDKLLVENPARAFVVREPLAR